MLDLIINIWHAIRPLFLFAFVIVIAIYLIPVSEDTHNEKAKKVEKPIQISKPLKETKQNPILAVDFTTSSFSATPSSRKLNSTKRAPKVFTAKSSIAVTKQLQKLTNNNASNAHLLESPIHIFYSTLTGTSERIANQVFKRLSSDETPILKNRKIYMDNIDYIEDLDDYFATPKKKNEDDAPEIYLFIVPSYETESPLDFFIESLKENYNDFRLDSRPLGKSIAGFCVFGIGDRESWPESEGKFCYQAMQVDKYLSKLGGRRIFPVGTGCVKTDLENQIDTWITRFLSTLEEGNSIAEPIDIADSDDEEDIDEDFEEGSDDLSSGESTLIDVEDIGNSIEATKKSRKINKMSSENTVKEMVAMNSPTYKALTKQGYTVVGSHSGVKICRWTKSALRGRGSCYKFSFYGIRSHLCMETTPSLSCSNKCVFCWRHGTNPVGTTWRWKVDPPDVIFQGALEGHYKKIKQMRGVPGVVAERFEEAFQVKHCALSLVGEPIFYPHINEFVNLLHGQGISSFLVCNAQHPEQLKNMKRVTQLYVSIDAPNKEALRKVDRPLNRDFWERFLECLDILREKKTQRTVFRLTLVAGYNMDDYDEYAELIARGEPCFVEVKGATFCGTSKSNPLTMKNVPFYKEVVEFVENLNAALARRGLDYGIAAEHAHSCCILMAQGRFKIEDRWHTVIDYKRFFELLKKEEEEGIEFGPMDYLQPTASWAIYGSKEGGFSPEDVRHRRGKVVEE